MAHPLGSNATASVLSLGYLGFAVSTLDAWETFAIDVLGLELGHRLSGGGFTLRTDGYQQRFFVEPGSADDVSVIGWQAKDEVALAAIARQVEAAGGAGGKGTAGESAARGG